MIGHIRITDRGPTPRNLRKVMTRAKKASWYDTAVFYHTKLRDKRFTEQHARAANYWARSKKYEQRKRAKFGHTRPLEYSGETRRSVRQARLTSTSRGNRIRYPGARKLNLRNPKSRIRMAEEFRRIPRREAREISLYLNKQLDRNLAADNTTTVTKVI